MPISNRKKAGEYWKSGPDKRKSPKMVQNRFRNIKTCKQLYRWEKYVESRGTQLGHNN